MPAAFDSTVRSQVPVGSILSSGLTAVPGGFLLCNGLAVSRTVYADLFAAIGTTYGVGDGVTTFNLPNLVGRAPIGAGTYTDPVLGPTVRTLGGAIGAAAHTLSVGEMPSHSHAALGGGQIAEIGGSGSLSWNGTGAPTNFSNSTTTSVGGGGSHNNMQPSLVLNWIIKT